MYVLLFKIKLHNQTSVETQFNCSIQCQSVAVKFKMSVSH